MCNLMSCIASSKKSVSRASSFATRVLMLLMLCVCGIVVCLCCFFLFFVCMCWCFCFLFCFCLGVVDASFRVRNYIKVELYFLFYIVLC